MFAQIAPRIYDNGYQSPLPVVAKRPVVPGWDAYNKKPVSEELLEEWCRRFPTASVGHAAGNGLAYVDVDILEPDLAAEADRLADALLGPTPAVRIGRAPKSLRVYRGTGIRSRKAHPIEIFGDTGQAVFYGTHPDTRQPYIWLDEDPLWLPADQLPLVTAEQIEAFLLAAGRIVQRRQQTRSASSQPVVDLDLFRRLRTERDRTRGRAWLRVLKQQLRTAEPGSLHNTLLSVVAALVRAGFTDRRIRSFVRCNFRAPRNGKYAEVWAQLDPAIAGARKRWEGRRKRDDDFEARVLQGLGQ